MIIFVNAAARQIERQKVTASTPPSGPVQPQRLKDIALVRDLLAMATRIDSHTASKEPWLTTTKWFDYRFMHPLQCTRHFAAAYTKVYKRKWDRNKSTEEAPFKLGTNAAGWESSQTEFTSMWRARQFVDQYCMPYETYLNWALEFALHRGYKNIPRPNQIYSRKYGEVMGKVATEKWVETIIEGKVPFSRMPQYHLRNYRSLPVQNDHQDWMLTWMRERTSKGWDIATLCHEEQVLPPARAGFEFGPYQMEKADRYRLAALPPPADDLLDRDFRPGCFGVVHAFNASETACANCTFVSGCERLSRSIVSIIVKNRGVEDPVNARKKQQQRDRTRRFRQRQRLAAGGGAGVTL